MVNAQDFTYSKGYVGLLSILGSSLGIIFCCATAVEQIYRQVRETCVKRAPKVSGINSAAVTRGESTPWSESRVVYVNEENITAAADTLDEIGLPVTKDNGTQSHTRITHWSVDEWLLGPIGLCRADYRDTAHFENDGARVM